MPSAESVSIVSKVLRMFQGRSLLVWDGFDPHRWAFCTNFPKHGSRGNSILFPFLCGDARPRQPRREVMGELENAAIEGLTDGSLISRKTDV